MKEKKDNELGFKPLFISGLIILLILITVPIIIYFNLKDWADRGAFGDLFGVVNALFSGLAFAGIIYTILLQRTELKLQREELEETRRELKRSADAQEKSEIAFLKQVYSMNQTTRINGLKSIVDYYNAKGQASSARGKNPYNDFENAMKYVKKIADIVKNIDND